MVEVTEPVPASSSIVPEPTPIDHHLLSFYRSEIRFESEVVNGRLQALLGSQSFLVIAYATAMTGSNNHWGSTLIVLIPVLFSLLGLVLALMAWPGIRAAYAAIAKWETKERALHDRCVSLANFTLAANENDSLDMTRRSQEGALFAHRAPLVFVIAWMIFAAIPFYLWLK